MAEPLLVVGNRKYSSWSLRAWIGLRMLELPFREHRVVLHRPETRAEILRYSPSGRVPALVAGAVTVYESLAILEYVNEAYAGGRLLPETVGERAVARSVCAEMHAGFADLRQALPMNLARDPAPPRDRGLLTTTVQEELTRILDLWEGLLAAHERTGPYLFGNWGMADCMYLPVATRFRTYAVDTRAHPRCTAYLARVLALPAFREWEAAGRAEAEHHPDYDR
jgi:glutathione S-transferase